MFYFSMVKNLYKSFTDIEQKSKYITVPLQIIVFTVFGILEVLLVDWWFIPMTLARDAKSMTPKKLLSVCKKRLALKDAEQHDDQRRHRGKLVIKIKKAMLKGKFKVILTDKAMLTNSYYGMPIRDLLNHLNKTLKGFEFDYISYWDKIILTWRFTK